MLAERVKEWTKEWWEQGWEEGRFQGKRVGRLEGRQQGKVEGQAALLIRLLERKLGPLEMTHRRRVEAADADQLLEWSERLLAARSLDDVFGEEQEQCLPPAFAASRLEDETTLWLSQALPPRRVSHVEVRPIEDLRELKRLLTEGVEEWMEEWRQQGRQEGRLDGLHEGRQEGRQEGKLEGQTALLTRLLERKFGPLEMTDRRRVEAADAEQLLEWSERVLTARSLDDVFR